MRYYTGQHQYYCGIDLHARTMYLCIVNQADDILYHKEIPTKADIFLEKLAPYREDVVVSVECIFTWYWLADLCAEQRIPFVLGHALYMKAIHGSKTKKRPHRFEEDCQTAAGRHDTDGVRVSEADALHP